MNTELHHDLTMPAGLNEQGQKAYQIIVEYLTQNGLMPKSVDWRIFHAPAEWQHEYGHRSHLVVAYEGCAPLKQVFSMDYCYEVVAAKRGYPECYAHYEALTEKLAKAGLFFEECTRWYAAIYTI